MSNATIKNAMTFEVLPTSTATPTTGTEFVTKTYSDDSFQPKPITSPVSWTGTWISPVPFNCSYSPPIILSSTNTLTTPLVMVTLSQASTPELYLTSIDLGSAQAMSSFTFNNIPVLTSFSGANITTCYANLAMQTAPLLTTWSFPELVYIVNGGLSGTMNSLTTISFPKLVYIAVSISINSTSLTSFSLPLLRASQNITLTVPVCTSINVDSAQFTLQGVNISAASLTTMNFPALVSVGTTFIMTAANLVTLSIGSTLKSLGGNFTVTGAKLDQASVDGILVRLAALDGTNGTTAYSSFTINLSGGTSSTPSATGLTAKATLQARSCTVTTN